MNEQRKQEIREATRYYSEANHAARGYNMAAHDLRHIAGQLTGLPKPDADVAQDVDDMCRRILEFADGLELKAAIVAVDSGVIVDRLQGMTFTATA